MADNKGSPLNQPQQTGMASSGAVPAAAVKPSIKELNTKAEHFFLSRSPQLNSRIKLADGAPFRVMFENYRFATDSKHVAECVKKDLVDRKLARAVDKQEYLDYGKIKEDK